MMILEIYKYSGLWCFTDTKRDLTHEPFVLGMSEIITHVIKEFKLGSDEDNYRVIFSEDKFPGYQGYLYYQYPEHGGNWYCLTTTLQSEPSQDDLKGWLCPATLKFFEMFPKSIYFKVELI